MPGVYFTSKSRGIGTGILMPVGYRYRVLGLGFRVIIDDAVV
jgi:hypothetical protein